MRSKRCSKGKSCGASCITKSKICRKDLNSNSSQSLRDVRDKVSTSGSPTLTTGGSPSDTTATVTLGLKTDKPEDFIAAGKAALDKYRSSLDSSIKKLQELKEEIRDIKGILADPNIKGAERKELNDRLTELGAKRFSLGIKLSATMEELRNDMLVPTVPQNVLDRAVNRVTISGFGAAEEAANRGRLLEFAKMFNGRGLGDEISSSGENRGPRLLNLAKLDSNEDQRAYAIPSKGLVKLKPVETNTIAFHEFAHIIENQYPQVFKFAEGWRDGRAFSEQQIKAENPSIAMAKVGNVSVVRLAEFVGPNNYGPNEIAVVDKFWNAYMGKVYPGSSSTEVLSMAVQAFAGSSDMVALYRAHPDLFEYVVGMAVSP